jgi:UDP-glucose 4-epimerase
VRTAHHHDGVAFEAFNVGTGDAITVTEIAALAIETLGLRREAVTLCYTGGGRGWKGDVPVVRLNCDSIRALGWRPRMRASEAIAHSISEILEVARVA